MTDDETTAINPHLVPDDYTELACLLGFVRRVAERRDNPTLVALCRRAQTGHPTAVSTVCAMAIELIERCAAEATP